MRQNLLLEGRLSKYLLYALGEILLVVLGILIALKINNWNIERLDKMSEAVYIQKLTKELETDIESYRFIQQRFLEKKNRLERIVRVWQSENPILIDSLQYIMDFKQAGNISIWYNEPITWAQMVQTGDLKLISDHDLIDALFKYFNMVKKAADNYAMHPMDVTNKARETAHIPFLYEDPSEYWKETVEIPGNYVFDKIWEMRMDYLQLYYKISIVSDFQAETLEDIIQSGEKLLTMLQNQID